MSPHSFQLVMKSGPAPDKIFALEKSELTIGRDISNDIVINDAEISRNHARLYTVAGGYVIEDLGSTNGTFVNGQRLMGPHALRPGELVMLGENVGLVFETVQVDADATMVATRGQVFPAPAPQSSTPQGQAAGAYKPVQPVQPRQVFTPGTPSFVGQVPPGPEDTFEVRQGQVQKKSSARTWLLAGCGCLLILTIGLVAILFVIDYLNLWCTLFGFIIPACP